MLGCESGRTFTYHMWGLGLHPQVLQQQKGSTFEISGDKENKMGGYGFERWFRSPDWPEAGGRQCLQQPQLGAGFC